MSIYASMYSNYSIPPQGFQSLLLIEIHTSVYLNIYMYMNMYKSRLGIYFLKIAKNNSFLTPNFCLPWWHYPFQWSFQDNIMKLSFSVHSSETKSIYPFQPIINNCFGFGILFSWKLPRSVSKTQCKLTLALYSWRKAQRA